MVPEQRLWIAVLLRGITEQDGAWLMSPEFDSMCRMTGLEPDMMRGLSAKDAARYFTRLMRGCGDRELIQLFVGRHN